jgi:hypothetical protein
MLPPFPENLQANFEIQRLIQWVAQCREILILPQVLV